MFIHVVFFWCKPGTSSEAKQAMIDYAHKEMPGIPSVRNVWAGTMVPSGRDVVDASYDVGLCVVFDDQAGHDQYQPHPIHLKFVEQFKQLWTKVRVHDFK